MDFLFCPQTAHLPSSGFTSRWVSYFIFYWTNRNQSETLPYSHCRICQFTYISPQTSAFPPVTMDKVFLLPSKANISLLPSQGCHPWSYAFSLTLWTTSKPYALPRVSPKSSPSLPHLIHGQGQGLAGNKRGTRVTVSVPFNFQPSVTFSCFILVLILFLGLSKSCPSLFSYLFLRLTNSYLCYYIYHKYNQIIM